MVACGPSHSWHEETVGNVDWIVRHRANTPVGVADTPGGVMYCSFTRGAVSLNGMQVMGDLQQEKEEEMDPNEGAVVAAGLEAAGPSLDMDEELRILEDEAKVLHTLNTALINPQNQSSLHLMPMGFGQTWLIHGCCMT